MALDKKQLPQLIVLGALVLVSVGYISFKVAAPKPVVPNPAAKAASETSASAEAESEITGPDSEALALLPPGEFPNLMVVPARRDPFTAQRMPGEEESKIVQVNTPPTKKPNNTYNPFKGNDASRKVPGFASIFGTGNQQPKVTLLPVEPPIKPEDLDPEFVLTGVVRGDENVAIIRVGQDGRYVVKEGQLIDGRYRVKSVTDDGAVLVYKNRSIHLKLGGVTNAS